MQLTPEGQSLVADISRRYGISPDSTVSMLTSVNRGGGTMAQFSIPEYGSGQWMRGGMIMVGDMFNNGLKATVDNLCTELSNALATTRLFAPPPPGTGNSWWPAEFGFPSSTGGQNDISYAIFPQARRLAIRRNGEVTIFDTLDHSIGGVSQQQGSDTSLTFSSQYGTCTTLQLPLVSGPGFQARGTTANFAAPAAPTYQQPQTNLSASETISLLEKLGQLREAGILTEEEFAAKKAELLQRL
jgi:hypothetical protein